MSISILTLLLSAAYADVSLVDAINLAQEIKPKNPVVFELIEGSPGVSPVYYTAVSKDYGRSRAQCRVYVTRMTKQMVSGLFNNRRLRPEIRYCWTKPASETRRENRRCLEGHWDNYFDGNEPHRNYVCDRYSETVDSYDVSIWFTMKACHNAHLAGADFTISCDLETTSATDTILKKDFEDSLGDAFELN